MHQDPFNDSQSPHIHASGNGSEPQELLPEVVEHRVEPETAESVPIQQEDVRAAQASFKRLYLILLVIGLVIGAILSVGVVSLLDRLGLSDPPSQVEKLTQ